MESGYYKDIVNNFDKWDKQRIKDHYLLTDNGDTGTIFKWMYDSVLKDSKSIIDMGCGNGLFALSYALNNDCRVSAIDGSRIFIKLARDLQERNNISNVYFEQSLSEELTGICKYVKTPFDAAFSQHSLEHFTCPGKALREQKGVAKVVCGILPSGMANDNPEHLWHWNIGDFIAFLTDIFKKFEVKVRGDLIGYIIWE
jgi:2-polyprenyl-3-methyl-5-hydroxy-6-metoxy-1,4-benzoquinol methylase